MEPNSPKKIQFAVPLFQSQIDPEAAESSSTYLLCFFCNCTCTLILTLHTNALNDFILNKSTQVYCMHIKQIIMLIIVI
uniref:Uncharacterized protein n=1 Tax=Malurus cyaneus samueli TaxID=2593467 RepID=A0A8C5TZ48_9PASS